MSFAHTADIIPSIKSSAIPSLSRQGTFKGLSTAIHIHKDTSSQKTCGISNKDLWSLPRAGNFKTEGNSTGKVEGSDG